MWSKEKIPEEAIADLCKIIQNTTTKKHYDRPTTETLLNDHFFFQDELDPSKTKNFKKCEIPDPNEKKHRENDLEKQYEIFSVKNYDSASTRNKKLEITALLHGFAKNKILCNKTKEDYAIEGEKTGGEGTVFIAQEGNLKKAIKERKILWQEKFSKLAEIRFLLGFEHPNIIKVENVFFSVLYDGEIRIGAKCYSVMPYVKFDLLNYFTAEKRTFEDARRILRQIVMALDHIHRNNVIHLDLKPNNILVDEFGKVSIVDLGGGKALQKTQEEIDPRSSNFTVTPNYCAPEVKAAQHEMSVYNGNRVKKLDNSESNQKNQPAKVTEKADIWSLGQIIYRLFVDRVPPSESRNIQTSHIQSRVEELFSEKISDESCNDICKIINDTLSDEPKNRPSCVELLTNYKLLSGSIPVNKEFCDKEVKSYRFDKAINSSFGSLTYCDKDFAYTVFSLQSLAKENHGPSQFALILF